MPGRRRVRAKPRAFTLEQLKTEHGRAWAAAKGKDGCVVVDKNGKQLFSIWVPQPHWFED